MADVVRDQLHAERRARRGEDASVAIDDVAARRLDAQRAHGVVGERRRRSSVWITWSWNSRPKNTANMTMMNAASTDAALDVGVAAPPTLIEHPGTQLRVVAMRVAAGRRPRRRATRRQDTARCDGNHERVDGGARDDPRAQSEKSTPGVRRGESNHASRVHGRERRRAAPTEARRPSSDVDGQRVATARAPTERVLASSARKRSTTKPHDAASSSQSRDHLRASANTTSRARSGRNAAGTASAPRARTPNTARTRSRASHDPSRRGGSSWSPPSVA